MRRTHLFALFAAVCLLSGCASDTPQVSTGNWQSIKNRDGFSLKMPPNWKVFNLETTEDLEKAKAYAKDKPSLKKLVDQILTVEQARLVALDPDDNIGMNVTRSNNMFHNLTIEELKDKLVTSTRNSLPWIGMPEAGIVDYPNGKAVLIKGLFPQQIGEDQLVEQYSFPSKNYVFTVSFLCVKSKQDKLSEFDRTITSNFDYDK